MDRSELRKESRTLYNRLYSIALPIALQNIISFSVGLADNVMVGSLGEVAISGVYLCNQIQVMLQMLINGVGTALLVLAAQYWGKKDKASVKSIIGIALKGAILCGVLFFVIMFFFPEQILSLYSNDAQVIKEAMKYLRIICFTYLFFSISSVLIAALRSIDTVNIGLYISIIGFILNVTLNWILIFGKLGAPALGIQGAAIATLITRVVECTFVIVYVLVIDKKLQYKIQDLLRHHQILFKDYIKYGMPIIMGDIIWGLNLTVQGGIVGRLGSSSIAAVSIANTIFSVISVGVYGTANASSVIIGNTVGEGDIPKIKRYTKKLQLIFLGVGIITGIVLFLIKDFITLIYQVEGETLIMARSLLIVLSITVVGTAYQMSTLTGIVRAGGATHFVFVNDTIFVWGIVIPLSMFVAFVIKAPTWVVFLCLKSDQILKCAVAVVKVNRYRWIKKLTQDF